MLSFLKCLCVLVCPNELLLQMGEARRGLTTLLRCGQNFDKYIRVPRKRRVAALSFGYGISITAFDISGLGLRRSEVSKRPMKGAL